MPAARQDRKQPSLPFQIPLFSFQVLSETPEKANLRSEVYQLRDTLQNTEVEANAVVNNVRRDVIQRAEALLNDQRSSFERTAGEFEEKARDICKVEVAQGRASIEGEALSALQQRDTSLRLESNSVMDLRSHLSSAQQTALEESEKKRRIIVEAENALNQQKVSIIREAEAAMHTQNVHSSSLVQELRLRASKAEGNLL
jgi:hypothetical protein